MLPVPFRLASLKVRTSGASPATPVEPMGGLSKVASAGAVVSGAAVVNRQVVVSAMPAKWLLERSLIAVATICT